MFVKVKCVDSQLYATKLKKKTAKREEKAAVNILTISN